jgi:hypothetical protein
MTIAFLAAACRSRDPGADARAGRIEPGKLAAVSFVVIGFAAQLSPPDRPGDCSGTGRDPRWPRLSYRRSGHMSRRPRCGCCARQRCRPTASPAILSADRRPQRSIAMRARDPLHLGHPQRGTQPRQLADHPHARWASCAELRFRTKSVAAGGVWRRRDRRRRLPGCHRAGT